MGRIAICGDTQEFKLTAEERHRPGDVPFLHTFITAHVCNTVSIMLLKYPLPKIILGQILSSMIFII